MRPTQRRAVLALGLLASVALLAPVAAAEDNLGSATARLPLVLACSNLALGDRLLSNLWGENYPLKPTVWVATWASCAPGGAVHEAGAKGAEAAGILYERLYAKALCSAVAGDEVLLWVGGVGVRALGGLRQGSVPPASYPPFSALRCV